MQEEVTQKTIALSMKTGKLTAQVLQTALKKFLEAKKHGPKLHQGQQSLKQLKQHGAALSNIEITDANIAAFKPCAKKYGVDFTLRKDKTTQPPHYIVIFKSRDADNLEQAFKEFTAKKLSREAKSDRRADHLDAARAAIPKETVKIKEKVFDEATGRAKTRVRRETRDKPPPSMKPNPASRPVQEVLLFAHGKIHEVEHENVGVEGGHKGEELAERQAGRAVRGAIRRHRLKPYRELSKAERLASFAIKHWKGCLVALALLIMVAFLMGGLQSCSSMVGGFGSGFTATSYLSDDDDLRTVENAYVNMEDALQRQIDNIPSAYPGYDEYRYNLDEIIHDPHELAAFLTAILPHYTLAEVQAELQRVFNEQYTLTITTTVEVRYRTETRTDSEGNDYDVEVPYNYYILNVKLTARTIQSLASELLTAEQLEMFNVYRETLGNNPLVFGGGSYDTSPSQDLSGVHFIDGERPGNTAVVDIAPGDAIFFDWDNSGNADHVGIVIGTDGTNVYTVEGNSGNVCKIKSYPLNSSVIRGYGLMNWD